MLVTDSIRKNPYAFVRDLQTNLMSMISFWSACGVGASLIMIYQSGQSQIPDHILGITLSFLVGTLTVFLLNRPAVSIDDSRSMNYNVRLSNRCCGICTVLYFTNLIVNYVYSSFVVDKLLVALISATIHIICCGVMFFLFFEKKRIK
ncbi:hypothetical protein [Photobacterium carnosum]|uniref:hypothetical protein n=1 Tax=Photobacterium carnosum TaxID=2023717 RepID=UPI001E5C815C|nr:hypothetical protein [Photobacterium carnosum]MCD9527547.1 hypothetical protein [Photobacterium carnosum]